jgi:hypothetical protein
VRATLIAIEGELALAMRPPRELAGSRLLRLRLLLLAVESSVLCLEEALRGLRAALRGAATAAGMTRHPEAGCSVLGGPCRVVACPGAACPGVCPGRWGTRPWRSSRPPAHTMLTDGPMHPLGIPKVENGLLQAARSQ